MTLRITYSSGKPFVVAFGQKTAIRVKVAPGVPGAQGPTGPQGEQGEQGPQGIQGIQGEQGIQGIPGADGADGTDGQNGNKIYQGSGAPDNGTGIDGDVYIRTSNGDYYQKAAGAWGSPIGNLTGPAGSGSGDVIGPAGATDGYVALFDGATGKLLKLGFAVSAFAQSFLDDANEAAFKATVNLEVGVDVQAYNANLTAIAALAVTDSNFIVGNGTTWVVESGATVRASLGLIIGTNVQAWDADLDALAALAATAGMLSRTGAGAFAVRTLTAPAAGFTISNGTGSGGNPTFALANDLAALEALTGTNTIYYRSAADTWTAVTIAASLTFSGGTLSATAASTTQAGVVELATGAEYRALTAGKGIDTDAVAAGLAEVTLTDAATITWDMAAGIDFTVTLAGNRTLGNPTNVTVGKRGRIRVVQDATGGRTLAKSSNHKTAGSAALSLSTAANAVDYIDYDAVSSTNIRLSLSKDWA